MADRQDLFDGWRAKRRIILRVGAMVRKRIQKTYTSVSLSQAANGVVCVRSRKWKFGWMQTPAQL